MTAFFPDETAFAAAYEKGRAQLVWAKRVLDTETPVSAMLKLMEHGKPCFLLESVEGGEVRGRYSILGLMPDLMWRASAERAELMTRPENGEWIPCPEGVIPSLRRLLASIRMDIPDGLPPITAGLIGYLGYDMIKRIEAIPSANPDPIGIPDACLMRPGLMLVFDSRDGVVWFMAPVWNSHAREKTAEDAWRAATSRIEAALEKLAAPFAISTQPKAETSAKLDFTSNLDEAAYATMVEKAKEYIRAGDVFQVVPSQRFCAPFPHPPFALYRSLRHRNPSPFLFYLHMPGFSLIGSSPEILVRVRKGDITIRPIAGTRPRGKTRDEDMALERELLADPKEIAEHLMLLDLGRNDAGRFARVGSVRVTEEMVVERYSHVMHIVSNVEAKLAPGATCFDALMGGFPAGTVSGAPKIRAMEIIDELEPVKRSFYAGCVGYFSADGSMDTCITLRTGLVKDGMLYVQAGGGVVADSDPQAEYRESCNKARAIMRAAESAGDFC